MDHAKRGVAVIINMLNFEDTNIEKRRGTEKDAESLEKVLKDQLSFESILLNDPKRQDIFDKLQKG